MRLVIARATVFVLAISLAMVGAIYLLIGLWLLLDRYIGPTGASFALSGLLFLGSAVLLVMAEKLAALFSTRDERNFRVRELGH